MVTNKPKLRRFQFTLDIKLQEELENSAAKEYRNINDHIKYIIKKYIKLEKAWKEHN